MEENKQAWDPIGDLMAGFWAMLPEETADNLAMFKQDVLTGVKHVVDGLIDSEIACMHQNVEKARQMRQEWNRQEPEPDADAPPSVA